MARPLPRSFFAEDADVVARALLGCALVHAPADGPRVAARIVETEAYFGPPTRNAHLRGRADMPATLRKRLLAKGDPAAHSFVGLTQRNRVMWGPPGAAYVYLIYGMHECLNVSTGPDGEPQAVLLRAGEPLEGIDAMRARRPAARSPEALCAGPGRLTQALGVTRSAYGHDMTTPPLFFQAGPPPARIRATPRIGVVGAEDLKLRFVDADSAFVSRPR